jgi:hypothetical protein
MSRGNLFGWSLPPGCGATPGEEDCGCEVCGRNTDDCLCPECLVCFEVGRPECYTPVSSGGCGCAKSLVQIASLIDAEAQRARDARDEYEYEKSLEEDREFSPLR